MDYGFGRTDFTLWGNYGSLIGFISEKVSTVEACGYVSFMKGDCIVYDGVIMRGIWSCALNIWCICVDYFGIMCHKCIYYGVLWGISAQKICLKPTAFYDFVV